jgi:hypothetical protein
MSELLKEWWMATHPNGRVGERTLDLASWLEGEADLKTLLRVDRRNEKADHYGGSHARGLERCVATMSPEEITAVLDDPDSFDPDNW